MNGARSLLLLLACLAAAACTSTRPVANGTAATQEPLPPPQAPKRREPLLERREEDRGQWGDRVLLEATVIPAAWLVRDLDGVRDNGDSNTSAGFGLRAASGNRDQSIGILWQGLNGGDDGIDVQAVGLDVDVRTSISDDEGPFYLRAGATLGGAWLDAPGDNRIDFQAQAQLRLGIDFQPTHYFQISPSIGGVVFGHPGETEAYGAIFALTFGFVF